MGPIRIQDSPQRQKFCKVVDHRVQNFARPGQVRNEHLRANLTPPPSIKVECVSLFDSSSRPNIARINTLVTVELQVPDHVTLSGAWFGVRHPWQKKRLQSPNRIWIDRQIAVADKPRKARSLTHLGHS
jgi:hypothetical protein